MLRVEERVGSGAGAQLTNCAEPASQGAAQVRSVPSEGSIVINTFLEQK